MKIKNSLRYFIVNIIMTLSLPLAAAESGIDKLNHFVQTVNTFKAEFTQTIFDSQGQQLEQAKGEFILERPGKFRWDYREPYAQQIIADGQHIWFYDMDLEQVTVKSQTETLADTPATLLSGNVLPEDKYILSNIDSEDGLLWVRLVPKAKESSFQIVTLAFDRTGLRQMIMKDSFDQKTRLVFNQEIENPELSDEIFKFVPPKGVDVIGQTGKASTQNEAQ